MFTITVTGAYSSDGFLFFIFFEMQIMHNTVHFCAKMHRIVHNLHFEKIQKSVSRIGFRDYFGHILKI